jgi:hypothetical protein
MPNERFEEVMAYLREELRKAGDEGPRREVSLAHKDLNAQTPVTPRSQVGRTAA